MYSPTISHISECRSISRNETPTQSSLHERRHDPHVLRWTAVCQDTFDHETGTRPAYKELPVTLIGWIDQDRKQAGLKALQGMIWNEGYRQRAFVPELYSDVLPALT